MPNHPAPRWSVVAVFISCLLITLITVCRINAAICELVRLQDDVYVSTPPPSPTGRELADAYHHWRVTRC